MSKHWDNRPIHWPPHSWNLFREGDADIKRLLDVYANQSSAQFVSAEEAIVEHLTRKALRAARWNHRLRIWRYAGQATARYARTMYAVHVLRHLRHLWARITNVAQKEEAAQVSESAKISEEKTDA